MKCRFCGVDNREGAGFCMNCGAPFATTTASPAAGSRRKNAIIVFASITVLLVVGLAGWGLYRSRENAGDATVNPSNSAADKERQARWDQEDCIKNINQADLALLMYEQDYDERAPLKETWVEGFQPYIKNIKVLACPARVETKVGFAFNANLAAMSMASIMSPAETVTLFDSNLGGSDPSDAGESWFAVHNEGANAGYTDGHAKWLKDKPNGPNAWADYLKQYPPPPATAPPPDYGTSTPYSGPSSFGSYPH